MSNKKVLLKENTEVISIVGSCENIIVSSDDTNVPIIKCSDEFDIEEHAGIAQIIKSRTSNQISFCNGSITMMGSNITILGNNNCVVVNGKTYDDGNSSIYCGEITDIQLIVPKKKEDLSIDINSRSGNIHANDLNLFQLSAHTMSGNIHVNNMDISYSDLETKSGNIDVTISESILNYQTSFHSYSGCTIKDSIETESPKILSKKKELKAASKSGNIKLLFQGKHNY